jgi:hypothetical protein
MKRLFAACIWAAAVASAAAQDQLSAARDLYASAAYEDALTTLTRLHEGGGAGVSAEQVEQYRAFCLFALGRTAEAQSVAEGLIARNPLLQLDDDASPRIAAMFGDVRKKLLPGLVRERYKTARGAIERKEFAAAEPQLAYLERMLDEAEKIGAADETLADLRVLVGGFMDLTRATNTRAAAPPPPTPAVAAAGTPAAAAPTSASGATRTENVPKPASPLYDHSAVDVVPPVTVRQEIPQIPRELMRTMLSTVKTATLELVIDENGNVERAAMRDELNPIYDRLVIAAAKTWKYRPATKGGTPVRYQKLISIIVNKQPSTPDGAPPISF